MDYNNTYTNHLVRLQDKIENGNGECVKLTTTRPQSRQQPKATIGSSIQRETPAPGGVLRLTPKQICILVSDNGLHTKLRRTCITIYLERHTVLELCKLQTHTSQVHYVFLQQSLVLIHTQWITTTRITAIWSCLISVCTKLGTVFGVWFAD